MFLVYQTGLGKVIVEDALPNEIKDYVELS